MGKLFSGVRALFRKIFILGPYNPQHDYSRLSERRTSRNAQLWRAVDLSEKEKVALGQAKKDRFYDKGHVPPEEMHKFIEQYFRASNLNLLEETAIVDHMGICFDHFYERLGNLTKMFNEEHPDGSRKGCLVEVAGIAYIDQGKFSSLMQHVDPSRKMGCFNFYQQVCLIMGMQSFSGRRRNSPAICELLRRAAMRYDMKQAALHADRGGAALIHLFPERARLDLIEEWHKLLEVAARSLTRPDVCATFGTGVTPAGTYEHSSARQVRQYSSKVLRVRFQDPPAYIA